MRSKAFLWLVATLVIMPLSINQWAQLPRLLSYQGKLTNASGVALDGDYDIVFKIWKHPTSTAPADSLWAEAHTGADAVHITNGLFDVNLGTLTPLNLAFNDTYWLELKVGTEILTPREMLASVPYSFRSIYSDTSNIAIYADTAVYISSGTIYTAPRLSGDGTEANPLDIAQQGATLNQVLKWNGTSWAPADDIGATGDNWGTQVVQHDATLTGNGTASSLLGTVIGNTVESSEITDGTIISADINNSYVTVSVRNSANAEQFQVTDGDNRIQFAGSGGLTVAFDAANHRVTVDGSGIVGSGQWEDDGTGTYARIIGNDGVRAYKSALAPYGLYGTGSTGVYGYGGNYGIAGYSATCGVYGSGTYGIYGNSSTYCGYFTGGGVIKLPVKDTPGDPLGVSWAEGSFYYNSFDHRLRIYDDATWTTVGGMNNPMTTAGDIIYAGAAGTPQRLPGSTVNGYVLAYNTATNTPYWKQDDVGGASLWIDEPAVERIYNNNAATVAERVYVYDNGNVVISDGDLVLTGGTTRTIWGDAEYSSYNHYNEAYGGDNGYIGFKFTPSVNITVTKARAMWAGNWYLLSASYTVLAGPITFTSNGVWQTQPLPVPVTLTAGNSYWLRMCWNPLYPYPYKDTPPSWEDGVIQNVNTSVLYGGGAGNCGISTLGPFDPWFAVIDIVYEVADGGTDGHIACANAIRTGSPTTTNYNHFGAGGTPNYANDNASDVYIQDELEVDGNAYIGGKLTVSGGIDPVYLSFTPQSSYPGLPNPGLWVDNGSPNNLFYWNGTNNINISAFAQLSCGTDNYVLKGSGGNSIICSGIYDNGTNVGIGTTTPQAKFHVNYSVGDVAGGFYYGIRSYLSANDNTDDNISTHNFGLISTATGSPTMDEDVYNFGVFSAANGSSGSGYTDNTGVRAYATGGVVNKGLDADVDGTAGTGYGVYISNEISNSYDQFGLKTEVTGNNSAGSKYGVMALCNGTAANNYGIYAWASGAMTNWAGYFVGDVNVIGSISKGGGSFLIDHPLDPLNKVLRHNFVESPENLCIYRGKIKLDDNGRAIVRMPGYFSALTKEDEASINLTPVGKPFIAGAEWNGNHTEFTIYGEPHREIWWTVYADRDDPVIRQLYHPVEEEKGSGNAWEKGKLLYPQAYGYPEEMGQNYRALLDKKVGKRSIDVDSILNSHSSGGF